MENHRVTFGRTERARIVNTYLLFTFIFMQTMG